ncbi:desulfoferrodoxin family protein [Acholeplasma hippikon]|uniref:Superoxide reductase n=1 Tax=Acholeplasma hippikon TaxID=264636 RepID=A0A449BI43_9MOLU|nr:desulfoferrodoxin family protein [Acholeplasma hippikon]VEU82131.1 Superoxide reductase [Acholeplasma hippikon]
MKIFECESCNDVWIKLQVAETMNCCQNELHQVKENMDPEVIETHTPIIKKMGDFIYVEVNKEHPMLDVHHLELIIIETNHGVHVKKLFSQNLIKAQFILTEGEVIINIYVYCNVHHLIKITDINLS